MSDASLLLVPAILSPAEVLDIGVPRFGCPKEAEEVSGADMLCWGTFGKTRDRGGVCKNPLYIGEAGDYSCQKWMKVEG